MVCDDYGTSPSIARAQAEYNEKVAIYQLAKKNCVNTAKAVEDAYGIFKVKRNNYNLFSNDKKSLQEEYERLEQEMKIEIRKAKETAEKEGKDQTEIDKICDGIRGSYIDKMMLVQYKITQKATPALNKNQSLFKDAEENYANARFNDIHATAIFFDKNRAVQNANYELGFLKQREIVSNYLQSKNILA